MIVDRELDKANADRVLAFLYGIVLHPFLTCEVLDFLTLCVMPKQL